MIGSTIEAIKVAKTDDIRIHEQANKPRGNKLHIGFKQCIEFFSDDDVGLVHHIEKARLAEPDTISCGIVMPAYSFAGDE
jgi:hypothetical protein